MTFLDALSLEGCKPKLDKGMQVFPCGLAIPDASAKRYAKRPYLTRFTAKLREAHRRHHDHGGKTSSFSFETKGRSMGNPYLSDAWCSCENPVEEYRWQAE